MGSHRLRWNAQGMAGEGATISPLIMHGPGQQAT
jgi:hypothetical protein